MTVVDNVNVAPKNAFGSFSFLNESWQKISDFNFVLPGSIVPKGWARDCPGTGTRALTGILQCALRGLHQLEALGLGLKD